MIRTYQKSEETGQAVWFWRTVTRDAFTIASTTWLILFVLEFLKPGIATNYVSLTRWAAGLFLLALVHVSLRQSQPDAVASASFSRKEILALVLVSLVAAAVIASVMPAVNLLTLLVISVTVLTIWIGSFLHREV